MLLSNADFLDDREPEWNMTNSGRHGTDDEWNRIEAPVGLLDPELDRFASRHGLTLTKNLRDWPERSLTWGTGVRCLIQVFLADKGTLTLNFWICASQDRGGSRFWKNEMLRKKVQAAELARDLPTLLDEGKNKLDQWSARPEELELATTLGR
jgi:hypothetical protein